MLSKKKTGLFGHYSSQFKTKADYIDIIGCYVLCIIVNCFNYYLAKAINVNRVHYLIDSRVDDLIPFIPWMLIVYYGAYGFWVFNYLLSADMDRKTFHRLVIAHTMAELICFISFVAMPTTLTRATITGDSFFERAVASLYKIDAPDCIFPSVHCMLSFFSWIAVKNNPRVPAWYRLFSMIFMLLICISTVTLKQHVLADVAGGVLLAWLSWLVADKLQNAWTKKHNM